MGVTKNCNTCFYQSLCDTYAEFGVADLGPENEAVCSFYKNKNTVKEIPCTCEKCSFSRTLTSRVLGVFAIKWYCTRCSSYPILVEPEGFCSFGKPKEDKRANG